MRKFLIACLLFSIVSLISTCDCGYRSKTWYGGGGCVITKPARTHYACRCQYYGWWSCSGSELNCDWENSVDGNCDKPDTSKKSCEYGRGDCGGY